MENIPIIGDKNPALKPKPFGNAFERVLDRLPVLGILTVLALKWARGRIYCPPVDRATSTLLVQE